MQTVLFVCPHGATRSVLAGSYFNRIATQVGLDVRAVARGTEPDGDISALVREDVGNSLCADHPTLLADEDIAAADLVVAFDLGEPELGVTPDRSWNSLPPLSGDFQLGHAAILGRVMALVAELQTNPRARD